MTMTKHGPLVLDGNVDRLAWTSELKTGMFNAHNHRHGRDLERNFYLVSRGFKWIRKKKSNNKK